MRRLALALLLALVGTAPALARDPLPERRLIVTRDTDFPGHDRAALFDTSLEGCVAQCLADAGCRAFTFNSRKNSCFPKSEVTARSPYAGAVSARVLTTPPEAQALASRRAADLDFLRAEDFDAARTEAEAMALRHSGGEHGPAALQTAAAEAADAGRIRDALHWTGAALAQEDSAALWLAYEARLGDAVTTARGAEARRLAGRRLPAALNAYLRAEAEETRTAALYRMALALEEARRGRSMIPALRLAEDIRSSFETSELLDEAIAKYGFRIVEHSVEADSAAPRICAEFNQPLRRAGLDYTPYLRLPDPRLAVSHDDRRICVSGVSHGARYRLTFRSGLPAEDGETLARDIEITAYVRDRAPSVLFPGRAYVLPRSPEAGLPVQTVNLDRVDLVLRRVSDRNLIRALQDNYFGQPLNRYDEEYFAEDIAEEIWRGSGSVENRLNAEMLTRLPMGAALEGQPAGIYALTASVPETGREDAGRATQWFLLSDIGLTTLQGSEGLTVVARHLGSAAPLPGLEVTLLAQANRALARATTDAEGVARFEAGLLRGAGSSAPALVMAKDGSADLAFLSLTDPGFDLSDRGVAGRAPSGPMDVFLTTDRGAYRTGEVVHATALLRDARAQALPGVPLEAVLHRPDGVEYARQRSDRDRAGGHVFRLPLGGAVPRGTWRLDIHADPEAPALASQVLLVEDFVPERIDFTLEMPVAPINPLAVPALQVAARYLFGAPGADLAIEGEVVLSTTATLEGFPGYRFGRHDDPAESRSASLAADLATDAAGRAALALPLPEIEALGRPLTARATLRLSEASGRPVERSLTRPVAPASAMIGIKPGFDGTLPEGATARFEVIALGPDLAPVEMAVDWQVNRVQTRYQWYQQYGAWQWEPVTTRETVARGSGRLGAAPLVVEAGIDWGQYEIVVERSEGAYLSAALDFSAGWYAAASERDTPDMLELSLDAPAYAPGETATLRMVPRAAGTALVTVLADRVVSMQAVPVTAGENSLTLPVTEDWGAGVYVTAQVIRPMDAHAGQTPARALGLAHAAVDPGPRQLALRFEAPAEAAPRTALKARLQIDGLAPGVPAHATVAVVDQGILNLTGFASPDPAAHYFGQRRLGVEIRDLYGRLIDGTNGAMGTIRSGGDGGAALSMQGPPPTEALVAFFSGPVTVDAEGGAALSFDLPDFNGSLRLMAVAWTEEGVGSAEAEVLVRDPVVISAALPRFLAPGDESRLLLELTHASGPAGEMALALTAEAGLGLDPEALPATVTLEPGGKARLALPLRAAEIGDHRIALRLTTPEGKRLTKDLTLGVRANDPATATTRRLSLAPGETFTLDSAVLAGLRPESAELLVSAGALARFDLPGLWAALDRYPYGCTEQVTSQALPLLALSTMAGPLGLGSEAQIAERIAQAVRQVLLRQAPNGAFGLWSAGSGDVWLDAYVTDFLSRARAAGHAVPEPAWQSALDNLKARIAYAPDFDRGGEDIAYALMVLARENAAAMGDLRYYADEKAEALATPLAQAQLGAALASYGDQPRADALFAKAAARLARQPAETTEPQLWRADYGSHLRDAAGVLSLAVAARSTAVDRMALAARITGAAAGRLSTQEQAWSLLAAEAMVQDPTVTGLALDGRPLSGPFVRRLPGAGLRPQRLTNTGAAETALTVTALGVPEGETAAGGHGYALSRAYYTLEGRPADLAALSAGDRLVTVLTVTPAEDTQARLMVDDALPAGFEIDNPQLLRGGDVSALDWLESAETEHAEFRAERFLAALNQQGAEPMRLAYVVRAVSPGRFHHPAALVTDMYRPEYRATSASGSVIIAE